MLLRNRRPPKCRVSYKTEDKSPRSSADKIKGACVLKEQTLKKTRTLLFPEIFGFAAPNSPTKQKEGKVLSRTAKTAKPPKPS